MENESDYMAGQIPQESCDPVQMMGSAVFKNAKMIVTLSGEETRTALLLRRKIITDYYVQSFPDPINDQYRVVMQLQRQDKMKMKMNFKNVVPEINITIPINL